MACKKVIIPKGTVSPNDTIVIEIPNTMQDAGVLVARSQESGDSSGGFKRFDSSGSYNASFGGSSNNSSGGYKQFGMSSNSSGGYKQLGRSARSSGGYQQIGASGNSSGGYMQFGAQDSLYGANFDPNLTPPEESYNSSRYSDSFESTLPSFKGAIASTPKKPNKDESQKEIEFMLDRVEYVEMDRIQKDLREYQSARRRFLFDASNFSG